MTKRESAASSNERLSDSIQELSLYENPRFAVRHALFNKRIREKHVIRTPNYLHMTIPIAYRIFRRDIFNPFFLWD